jgi:glyoxylase-like metal-dependent hydrolase (beta-lactamase superfamily II)
MKKVKHAAFLLVFLISASNLLFAQSQTIASSISIDRFIPFVNRVEAGDGHLPNVWGRQNSYLLETRHGIIIFDALRTVKEATAINAMADELGKPVLAVILTHAHPDHYGGITVILKAHPGAQVITTKLVAKALVANFAIRNAGLIKQLGSAWPAQLATPTRTVNSGDTLMFDGVKITGFDTGPGESDADTYWLADGYSFKAAFIGDLVLYHQPSAGQSGHLSDWLCSLRKLRQTLAGYNTLYPGHGESGGVELIEWESNYLNFYWLTVASILNGDKTLSDQGKEDLRRRMLTYLPDDKANAYILFSIDTFVKEVVEKGPIPPQCN